MSNMLEQAIADAKALKEAALKNAETTILEKYSQEIKGVVDQLLQEEEDILFAGEDPSQEVLDHIIESAIFAPLHNPNHVKGI